jgi:uncharacterized membrane protein
MEKRDKGKALFYILSAVGIIVCILTELEKISPAIRDLCGGDSGGCAKVGESEYSRLLGIPLGILGLLSYLVWIGIYRYRKTLAVYFGAVIMGAEVYFLFLMASVLQVYCPLCLAQFTVVLIMNILLFATVTPDKDKEKFRAVGVLAIAASFLVFYVPHKMTFKGVEKHVESITSWGDSSSKYRMEVFSDYQCSHCRKFDETIKDVIKSYPRIYIVFRDMILPNHKLAPMAISYAGSVAFYEGQEMYLKARFEIFDNQKNLFKYIVPRFEAIRDDPEMKNAIKAKLKKDFELAKTIDVRSTPTTILVRDGRMVLKFSGNRPFAKLKPDLDKLVSR